MAGWIPAGSGATPTPPPRRRWSRASFMAGRGSSLSHYRFCCRFSRTGARGKTRASRPSSCSGARVASRGRPSRAWRSVTGAGRPLGWALVRVARSESDRLRHGGVPAVPGVSRAPLPRPGRAGLHEGRRLPHQHHRSRRRPGGGLRLLAGPHGALERGPGPIRRVRAGSLHREAREPARSGASTVCTGPLRCGVAWNTLFLAILVGARHDDASVWPSP